MEFKGQDSNAYPNIAKGQLDKESIEDISESAEYKSGNNVSCVWETIYQVNDSDYSFKQYQTYSLETNQKILCLVKKVAKTKVSIT